MTTGEKLFGSTHQLGALNLDGSVYSSCGVSGYGGVIRFSSGDWILGYASKFSSMNILEMEVDSIIVGLKLAWDSGFREVICEMDYLQTSMLLSSESSMFFLEFQAHLHMYHELIARPWLVQLNHIPMSVTLVANSLVKYGAKEQCDLRVMTIPLPELNHVLHHDFVSVKWFVCCCFFLVCQNKKQYLY